MTSSRYCHDGPRNFVSPDDMRCPVTVGGGDSVVTGKYTVRLTIVAVEVRAAQTLAEWEAEQEQAA